MKKQKSIGKRFFKIVVIVAFLFVVFCLLNADALKLILGNNTSITDGVVAFKEALLTGDPELISQTEESLFYLLQRNEVRIDEPINLTTSCF